MSSAFLFALMARRPGPNRRWRALAGLLFAGLAAAPVAAAPTQGWRTAPAGAATAAFYAVGDARPIFIGCAGLPAGRVSLRFEGFAAGLPLDGAYTVVVSANDIAFLQETHPVARADGGHDLARTAALGELQPMIEALKKGRTVEVSTPAGRVTLPLTGSGKALAAFEAGCRG